MDHLIVLNLGQGNWKDGFPTVIAQLWESGRSTPMQFTGSLPATPTLVDRLTRWRSIYTALYAHLGLRRSEFELDDDEPTHISAAEFHQLTHEVQSQFNLWLSASSFRAIDRQLRTRLSPKDSIRLMVVAHDRQILQLPWCLWDFLSDYPYAEVALSLPEFARSLQLPNPNRRKKVRILSILGNSQGIDVERDRALLQKLPNAEVHCLVEPTPQALQETLWQSAWDVLFFAGHSSTDVKGYIQINRTETLTIEQLKYSLRHAIAQGLKLAIFNSCDGLGLAQDLADLQLPQVIVMREPVPDHIAQEFLKSFLSSFSSGQSLYQSVREAREKLQALESDFPCATWLPVICQNPSEVPPTWQDWCGQKRQLLPPMSRSQLQTIALSTLAITGLVSGIRWFGAMQSIELQAFDVLMQHRPVEPPDPRVLIVKIEEEDIQRQPQNGGSISDETLDRVLETLERHQARVVGLDLYRDFPTQRPSLKKRMAQMAQNAQLVAICKRRDPDSNDPTGIAPPAEISADAVGFSDVVQDRDGVLRRHLLFASADEIGTCATAYSLSVQLAFRYLSTQTSPIAPEFTSDQHLKFGSTVFPALTEPTSGYQRFDARGSQILLNYRSTKSPIEVAQQVTVRQLLNGEMNLNAIQDRIVLIGVTAPSAKDYFATPYGRGFSQQLPGVIVQAHMVSQMISAVLDKRPLLWVWSTAIEVMWIGAWTVFGGLLIWRFRQLKWIAIAGAGCIFLLIAGCWFVLTQAGWIPLVPALLGFLLNGGTVAYRFLASSQPNSL
ncbi:MAG: CHASE2 domain-containing protein [Leptolyngbya sp. UWPOB_LEPTO1]|uniref:CHASE2 domain-containing protein n=1 Tax=Leptolyngbya sp. UWPOB_LEPTO1 TaxID=2815653 RepID=UPI001AC6DA7C|nr:CHASE2 domain-containing protein [Leptolyngbya sp. UWPOB_LEPTO1]MBN8559408.1 CHASE2 domain-containing protein [Leptolyngbya sp. UWPOB_LEPTO1]